MNYKVFIITLVLVSVLTGCDRPAAETGEPVEVSPSLEQVTDTKEDATSDATPEAGEEEKATGPDPETEQSEPETVPPADYIPARPDPEF